MEKKLILGNRGEQHKPNIDELSSFSVQISGRHGKQIWRFEITERSGTSSENE